MMERKSLVIALFALLGGLTGAACYEEQFFVCSDDADCTTSGSSGICVEDTDSCAFSGPGCASGIRYGTAVGGGNMGNCVDCDLLAGRCLPGAEDAPCEKPDCIACLNCAVEDACSAEANVCQDREDPNSPSPCEFRLGCHLEQRSGCSDLDEVTGGPEMKACLLTQCADSCL